VHTGAQRHANCSD